MNKIIKIALLLIMLFSVNDVLKCQSSDTISYNISFIPDILLKRNSEVLNKFSPLLSIGFGKFMPVSLVNGVGSWESSGLMYFVNESPINNFPLNFNTVDLVSSDILNLNSIAIKNRPAIVNGLLAPEGAVNLSNDSISKALRISARLFTGSETGDPIIYNFTRENISVANKNKVVPSGVISIENSLSNFAYRFSGGYFGFYNTGSIYDGAIGELSPYYMNKQNKQYYSSLLLNYKLSNEQIIKFESSFISYYGWDLIPFITSLTHSEFYLFNNNLSFRNILPNVSISFLENSSYNKINKINFVPECKFSNDKYTFITDWQPIVKDNFSLGIQADLNLLQLTNRNNNPGSSVDFYKENLHKFYYGISFSFSGRPYTNININSNLRLDKYFDNEVTPSVDIELKYSFDNINNLGLSISSIAKLPNTNELYGRFQNFRQISDLSITSFQIKGNEFLKTQRNNYFGINYCYSNSNFSFSPEYFIYLIDNPIEQLLYSELFSFYPGDFVRDAEYFNSENKKAGGINLSASINYAGLELSSFYRLLDNTDYLFSPRHSVNINAKYPVLTGTSLIVNYFYKSKTKWNQFRTLPLDKYELMPYSTLDLSIDCTLQDFYVFQEVAFKIALENIFNNQWQYIPIGNKNGRTVMVYLAVSK